MSTLNCHHFPSLLVMWNFTVILPKKWTNSGKTTESLLNTDGQPGQLSNCHLVLDHRAWLDVQVSMASIPCWSLTKVVSNLICCHPTTCWLHGATVTSMIQSYSMISSFTKCWKGLLQFCCLKGHLERIDESTNKRMKMNYLDLQLLQIMGIIIHHHIHLIYICIYMYTYI